MKLMFPSVSGAALSLKSFFARPFKKYLEAYRHKFGWAKDSFSDCLAYLNAYNVSSVYLSCMCHMHAFPLLCQILGFFHTEPLVQEHASSIFLDLSNLFKLIIYL